MAYAKLVGKENLIKQFKALPAELGGETARNAVREGAKILQFAIERNSPVGGYFTGYFRSDKKPHHSIRQNIGIKEIKNPELIYQAEKDLATIYIVGPKKKAFHGHFIDKGWVAVGRAGRRTRKAHMNVGGGMSHSQRGTAIKGNFIPGTYFVEQAGESAKSRVIETMKGVLRKAVSAFNAKRGIK